MHGHIDLIGETLPSCEKEVRRLCIVNEERRAQKLVRRFEKRVIYLLRNKTLVEVKNIAQELNGHLRTKLAVLEM